MSDKYKTLDSVLADMPRLHEIENDMTKKDHPIFWLRQAADPAKDPYCFFFKNGKRGYESRCENYKGYYNAGSSSAVQCKACSFLLPGSILEIYCKRHHDECPLRGDAVISDVLPDGKLNK